MTTSNTEHPIWYAAGRIELSRNRFGVTPCGMDAYELTDIAPITSGVSFRYSGPYTVACDHGCGHITGTVADRKCNEWRRQETAGSATHGAGGRGCGSYPERTPHRQIFSRSLDGIRKADFFFVWIEDQECFGTLVEIGYARALGKTIILAHAPGIAPTGELWFAFQSADFVCCFPDADLAFMSALKAFPRKEV